MKTSIYVVTMAIGMSVYLFGCAADRPADVPASAGIQAAGDSSLTFTPPADGEIWVSDVGSNNIVYSGHVRQGDSVMVDPDKNQVTVNGLVAVNHDISHSSHKIYFESGHGFNHDSNVASNNAPRPGDVPSAANIRAEGNQRVTYTADSGGTVWVTDADHNTVLYSGRVNRGDTVVVDPTQNALTLNGSKVFDRDIPHDNLRIFFLNEDMRPDRSSPAVGRID
jgi:hypothetical protein